jgi:oxygen-dependent protoporphyrinogen oxidase
VLGIPTRIGPFVRTGLFTWAGKLRMASELFVPARRDGADESIGSFMRRRFGEEATTYLAEPLLAGIHAGDVDRLSIKALFPRLAETERTQGSLIAAFSRAAPSAAAADGAFRSLPGGLSEMVCALAARLPPDALRFSTPARRVLVAPARVETAAGESLSARAVIITAPAYVAGDLLRDQDGDIARMCQEVRYASTATIALAFPRSAVTHPLNGSGFVVPRTERTGILAASWLSSKWPHRAPDDRVLMRAFFGGARDEHALDQSDTQLEDVALSALRRLLGISGDPLLSRVYRFDRASPQHEVGHLARIEALDRRLAQTPGLFMTGSGLRGVGIPDCVADARATAKKACEWLQQN